MASPVYGDSYGDLSRNLQAATNARQAALANALNTAVSALSAARAHQTELQRMQTQKDQFAQEMQFRQSQEAERTKEAAQSAGLGERYYNLAVKTEADKATQLTPAKQREHDMSFNQADTDAAQGTFDSPDHVLKMYPVLSPSEAMVIANRSADARRQIVSDFTTANNAAQVLNTHQALTKRVYQIDDAAKMYQDNGVPATYPMVRNLATQKQRTARQLQQIEPIATALNKDKNVQNLVTFDPQTERYVPTVAAPRWMTSGVANAPDAGQGGEADAESGDPNGGQAAASTRTSTGGGTAAPSRTMTATQAPAAAQTSSEPTVKVRGRDGAIYNIPQSKVRVALTRGGALVPTPTTVQSAPVGTALNMVERGMLH